jgi:hypothetical protein
VGRYALRKGNTVVSNINHTPCNAHEQIAGTADKGEGPSHHDFSDRDFRSPPIFRGRSSRRSHPPTAREVFGVCNNTISHAASYDQRQVVGLPGHLCPPCSADLAAGNDLQDPSTWVPPPLRTAAASSQDNSNGKLVLPQLNRLHEAFKRSRVSPPGVFQLSGPAAH